MTKARGAPPLALPARKSRAASPPPRSETDPSVAVGAPAPVPPGRGKEVVRTTVRVSFGADPTILARWTGLDPTIRFRR